MFQSIFPTFKVFPFQVNAIKREIREVEEGMEVVMKKFAGDMSSLCRMVVCLPFWTLE